MTRSPGARFHKPHIPLKFPAKYLDLVPSEADMRLAPDPEVREAPSWPRSWANFSLLSLLSHRDAWANLISSGPT